MFSVALKRTISAAVQKLLQETRHPELPDSEIAFHLHVDGASPLSWADIKNNGAVQPPSVKRPATRLLVAAKRLLARHDYCFDPTGDPAGCWQQLREAVEGMLENPKC